MDRKIRTTSRKEVSRLGNTIHTQRIRITKNVASKGVSTVVLSRCRMIVVSDLPEPYLFDLLSLSLRRTIIRRPWHAWLPMFMLVAPRCPALSWPLWAISTSKVRNWNSWKEGTRVYMCAWTNGYTWARLAGFYGVIWLKFLQHN